MIDGKWNPNPTIFLASNLKVHQLLIHSANNPVGEWASRKQSKIISKGSIRFNHIMMIIKRKLEK